MDRKDRRIIEILESEVPPHTINSRWYIIAGGPCSGKTTVLEELQRNGFQVLRETAEELLKTAVNSGKTVEEVRKDPISWQQKVAWEDFSIMQNIAKEKHVFADTSMLETYAFARRAGMDFGTNLQQFLRMFRFRKVFFLEPLELYETTLVRREDQRTALALSREILAIYREFDYDPIILPPISIQKRVALILENMD